MKSLAPALGLLLLAATASAGELAIHVLRVGNGGQGSSTFVLGPDGTRVLIDAGNNGDGDAIVRPYLLSLGVTDLDYAIASHYDADHIGGMDEVFDGGHLPDVAYDRGNANVPGTITVTGYLTSAGGVRATASVGTTIPLGDGAYLEVVAVNGLTLGGGGQVLTGSETQYENASSITCVVHYRDFEFYVSGDLTAGGNGTPDVESDVAMAVGQVEVAVAGHHGSFTSSSSLAVNNLAPSLVLYSAGEDNAFNHPDDRIVERWSTPLATRVQWCTTAGDTTTAFEAQGFTEVGETIVITTDGERFTARGADPGEELLFTTHENPGPIPTVANASGPTSLAITELLVDPQGASDSFGEWFEVTNVAVQPVDLFGTRFQFGANSFTLASRILLRTGESIVLGDDGKRYRNGDLFVHAGPSAGLLDLSDGDGTLTAINVNDQTIESVGWGASGGLPTATGATTSRLASDAPGTPGNFVVSTAPWGASTDAGSPGAHDPGDLTAWDAALWAPDPYVGGKAEFHLTSLQDPDALRFVGLSESITFPFTVFGQSWFLVPTPFFAAQAADPIFLGQLDATGRGLVQLQLPADPGLAGTLVFTQMLVLEFSPSLVGVRSSNFDQVTIQP